MWNTVDLHIVLYIFINIVTKEQLATRRASSSRNGGGVEDDPFIAARPPPEMEEGIAMQRASSSRNGVGYSDATMIYFSMWRNYLFMLRILSFLFGQLLTFFLSCF